MESKSLIAEFKKLNKEINPRPEWIAQNRALLLKQINSEVKSENASVGLTGYFSLFTQVFRQSLLEPAVVMFLVLATFLGSSLTINAAFYSLPGEPLYQVKIALEKTHAALTTDANQKAELKVEFAQKRVAELDKIVAAEDVTPEVKKEKIKVLVEQLKSNVTAVNDHLAKVNQSIKEDGTPTINKEKTLRMAVSISSKVDELVKTIDEKVEGLSLAEKAEVQDMVQEAVESVQQTGLSAQELIEVANQSTAEETNNESPAEVTEGADNQATKNETKAPVENGEAVKMQTVNPAENVEPAKTGQVVE